MIAGILGQKGCGKSTLLREFVRQNERVILLDPLGEHSVCGVVPASLPGLLAYWARTWRGKFRIVVQPHELDPDLTPGEALRRYGQLIRASAYNCLIAVDEVGHLGDAWHTDPAVEWLAHYGRHHGVSLVWVARRPAEVPTVLRSQADALYVFRVADHHDLNQIRERCGDQADEFVDLPDYTCAVWRPGEALKRIRVTPCSSK